MAGDNDIAVSNSSDSPSRITRRALLKELSKASSVMGAMLLPTHWTTPLMEFSKGTAWSANCSNTPGVNSCSGSTLFLPFPAGATSTVSFGLVWYGLLASSPSNQVTARLNRADRKVQLSLSGPLAFGLVPSNASLDKTADPILSFSFTDGSTSKLSVQLISASAAGTTCYTTTGKGRYVTESFSIDLLMVGTSESYSLSVTNFRSSEC